MKIGIYLGDIKKPNSFGGLTFEFSFVDELLKNKSGHEFVFYYFGENNIFENQDNARFVCLKYYKKPDFSNSLNFKFQKVPLFSLNGRLKKDNINVVYFLTPYLYEHIEIPYFAAIRNVSHRILPHFPEFSSNSAVEKTEKKLSLFLKSASKIITFNEVAKNDIKTLYNIIDENIEIINLPCPNWIKNAVSDEKILEKNALIKNSYIFYPAQFWTHKNHIRLILAAQIIKEQNMNLDIVFTGLDRGNKKYLKRQAKNLNIEDCIKFLDYVNQNELCALYKNAYAFVYPSLAGVDSIAALEALYCNCPVLISNHLGYNKQLNNAALYFNPLDEADIVEKITALNNPAIKDGLISIGQSLINENTSENYINKFLNNMDSFYLTRQCWSLKESHKTK